MQPARTYGNGAKVILCAEDDDAAYSLMELGFDETGGDFRLYRVEDGTQALDFLRHAGPYALVPKPDLVLLNLNMPRLGGIGVLEAVKQDHTLANVPVVVFSSSSLDVDRGRCLALGARSFLTKPTDLNDFLAILRHVCDLAGTPGR